MNIIPLFSYLPLVSHMLVGSGTALEHKIYTQLGETLVEY